MFSCISSATPTLPCLDSRESSKTWGLFVQDEFAITDKLTLNLGVRHDNLYRGTDSTNPRAGLIYNPTESTTLKLLYGTAFRAPNGYELFYTGVTYQPNPDLAPEKIKTLEFAVEHSFSRNLRGTASLYGYRLSDLIALDEEIGPDNLPGTGDDFFIFRNLSQVKAHGLDLELQGKWTRLEGRFSYSHQRTEDQDSGDSLPNAPRHMVKLNIIAPLYQEKLFAGFEAQYMSKRLNVQNLSETRVNNVPDVTIANLTLTQLNWIRGLEVSAGVYNLFDKRYREPNSGDEDDTVLNGNPQEGRSFRLKLSYKF